MHTQPRFPRKRHTDTHLRLHWSFQDYQLQRQTSTGTLDMHAADTLQAGRLQNGKLRRRRRLNLRTDVRSGLLPLNAHILSRQFSSGVTH